MTDSFLTIEKSSVCELIEKKSRFIAYAEPVSTEADALKFISQIKAKHWDARHNVFAYFIREDNVCRYSDDGEPHGTAGVPVLDVIKKNRLKNVVIVVTRYFGGVLLGTGGLVRAYTQAACLALERACVAKMRLCCDCSLICNYNQYGKLVKIIEDCFGVIDQTDFSLSITVFFHLIKDNFSALSKKVSEFSSGQLQCDVLGEHFYSI